MRAPANLFVASLDLERAQLPVDERRLERLYTRALDLHGKTSPGMCALSTDLCMRVRARVQGRVLRVLIFLHASYKMVFSVTTDLWIHYASYYLDRNVHDKALVVFWKARRALTTKLARGVFVERYQRAAGQSGSGGGAVMPSPSAAGNDEQDQ